MNETRSWPLERVLFLMAGTMLMSFAFALRSRDSTGHLEG